MKKATTTKKQNPEMIKMVITQSGMDYYQRHIEPRATDRLTKNHKAIKLLATTEGISLIESKVADYLEQMNYAWRDVETSNFFDETENLGRPMYMWVELTQQGLDYARGMSSDAIVDEIEKALEKMADLPSDQHGVIREIGNKLIEKGWAVMSQKPDYIINLSGKSFPVTSEQTISTDASNLTTVVITRKGIAYYNKNLKDQNITDLEGLDKAIYQAVSNPENQLTVTVSKEVAGDLLKEKMAKEKVSFVAGADSKEAKTHIDKFVSSIPDKGDEEHFAKPVLSRFDEIVGEQFPAEKPESLPLIIRVKNLSDKILENVKLFDYEYKNQNLVSYANICTNNPEGYDMLLREKMLKENTIGLLYATAKSYIPEFEHRQLYQQINLSYENANGVVVSKPMYLRLDPMQMQVSCSICRITFKLNFERNIVLSKLYPDTEMTIQIYPKSRK